MATVTVVIVRMRVNVSRVIVMQGEDRGSGRFHCGLSAAQCTAMRALVT